MILRSSWRTGLRHRNARFFFQRILVNRKSVLQILNRAFQTVSGFLIHIARRRLQSGGRNEPRHSRWRNVPRVLVVVGGIEADHRPLQVSCVERCEPIYTAQAYVSFRFHLVQFHISSGVRGLPAARPLVHRGRPVSFAGPSFSITFDHFCTSILLSSVCRPILPLITVLQDMTSIVPS